MHSHMLKQSTIASQEVPTQDVLALDNNSSSESRYISACEAAEECDFFLG